MRGECRPHRKHIWSSISKFELCEYATTSRYVDGTCTPTCDSSSMLAHSLLTIPAPVSDTVPGKNLPRQAARDQGRPKLGQLTSSLIFTEGKSVVSPQRSVFQALSLFVKATVHSRYSVRQPSWPACLPYVPREGLCAIFHTVAQR